MSYILTIYSEKIFKEIILPSIDNTDYSLVLDQNDFLLPNDLTIHMEVVNHEWSFSEGLGYEIFQGDRRFLHRKIEKDHLLDLQIFGNLLFTVWVNVRENYFPVYKKYRIPANGIISIGQDEANQICYDALGLVSKQHCVLEASSGRCILRDTSSNGIYINGKKSEKLQMLEFGDRINIFGLQIVYFQDMLAIDCSREGLRVDEYSFDTLEEKELKEWMSHQPEQGYGPIKKYYFNRNPRNIEKLTEDIEEIEGPPVGEKLDKTPLLLTIGPSLTMALPMVLGTVLMSIGSNGSTGFMYTGLTMAVGSALLGTIWALARIRYSKKHFLEEETARKEAYAAYLREEEEKIHEKYEENRRILQNRYLPPQTLCTMRNDMTYLWNRNISHPDFLYHRLGIGEMAFQTEIAIPKKRFAVHKDPMADGPGEIYEKYKILKDVPVGVDLKEHPLIGVVGGHGKAGAYEIARLLLAQISGNNCYTDVKIGLIYDGNNSMERECLEKFKWIPHVWSEGKKNRYVADSKVKAADVFYEITRVLRERAENEDNARRQIFPKPYYVLFITDTSYLQGELISKYILEPRAEYGVTAILMAERLEELPNNCEYIIENDQHMTGCYSVRQDLEERKEIRFDSIGNQELEGYVRYLGNLEVREIETGGEIPSSITFFDMMGVQSLSELNVLSRWKKNRTYDSMKALLGQKAGGVPCYLDIHEKYHGPHGLVAGTTGSGKSETLQTYMLSLAINYSPEDVGFFIIDYKGGGMAHLFDGLPHVCGQISNLSGNQVRRAMVSIKSENRRRQRIFNEHGVNNINSYTRLVKSNEAKVPIPHLFIIIDEFAELKREEPDFMRELISVAQVGRSLGVHLILATQKPSGTVDDNIWSNSKFRLCLRVQDRQDSMDMLHKPDAAYITQAGRGYLQVGNDELFELFQSGWSGAAYDEEGDGGKTEIVKILTIDGKAALVGNRVQMKRQERNRHQWISTLLSAIELACQMEAEHTGGEGQSGLGASDRILRTVYEILAKADIAYGENEYNSRRLADLLVLYQGAYGDSLEEKTDTVIQMADSRRIRLPERKQKTQLDAVVGYLADVAKQNHYLQPATLWLPVLPEFLYYSSISRDVPVFDGVRWAEQEEWNLRCPIGLYDDPENQSQLPLEVDFGEGGNHALIGMVSTGKSVFLQTLIYGLAVKYSPAQVNIYGLDFSSNSLKAYEQLPHVGGIMYENDGEKISRFFVMIEGILQMRKQKLRGGTFEQFVSVNRNAMPAIVIVIDQFGSFREKTGDKFEKNLVRIAAEGNAYGIYLAVSAAGFGLAEIPGNIGRSIKNTICLELADKFAYSEMLHTTPIRVLPEEGIKGRGLAKVGENVLEFQTALSVEAADDYERIKKLENMAVRMKEAWKGKAARPVPEIPEKPRIEDLLNAPGVSELLEDSYSLPVGYCCRDASPFAVDLRNVYNYIISGKSRSGKTNTLRVLMEMAGRKQAEIVLIDFEKKLEFLTREQEIRYVTDDQELFQFLSDLLPDFVRRNKKKKELASRGTEDAEIFRGMSDERKVCIFIDNLAQFINHVYHPAAGVGEMSSCVENFMDKGALHQIYFFSCYNQNDYSKLVGIPAYESMVQQKTGLHLGGNITVQKVLNLDYVPYGEQSKSQKAGLAYISASDKEEITGKVVIPLAGGR